MNKLLLKLFKIFAIKGFITICLFILPGCANTGSEDGEWVQLFNGRDFEGWVVPEGESGWTIIDGVIDCDPKYRAEGAPSWRETYVWSEKEYSDFILRIDWRIKDTPAMGNVPLIRPDGTHQLNAQGEQIRIQMPVSDSGIILRDMGKAQVNIWTWPIGSGEIFGYRVDRELPPEVIAGATPTMMADNHIGEWNTFEITMIGDRITVDLNGHTVIEDAWLPDVPEKGPFGLQHHGSYRDGEYRSGPSLVQFREIYIKEL